jgi:hypothetical protein
MTRSATPALIIGLAMALLLPASGQAVPVLSVGSATGQPGTTVDVPISFANDSNIVALQMDVLFDPAEVTAGVPVIGPGVVTDHEIDSSLVAAGQLRIIIYSPTSTILASGDVAVIPFTLAVSVVAPVPLDLANQQYVQAFAVIVAGSTTDGVIGLGPPCVPGDVFPDGLGDELTNLLDVVHTRRKILANSPRNARDLGCGNQFPGDIVCQEGSGIKHWCARPDAFFSLGDLIVLRRIVLRIYTVTCAGCAPRGGVPEPYVPGDVAPRGATNGIVDVADVVTALRVSVGLETATPDERAKADVAPSLRQGALTLAQGNGSIDVADVVLMLRTAVGLEQLAWPQRRLAVRLDTPSPHVAFSAAVTGWPEWAEPVAAESPQCAAADVPLEVAGSRWAAICVADPVVSSGPADLLTITFRGPRVDVAGLALELQLAGPDMALVPGQASLLAR